jgi:glycerophosphoryl diester phosphodiesterase
MHTTSIALIAAFLLHGCVAGPGEGLPHDANPVAGIMAQIRNERSALVMVAAHRGAHKNAPENSLASIEEAIRLGVDIVELDIRVTRDGVPVLMHDATVDATTDGTGSVDQMTFDQVRQLRLKARRGREPSIPLTDALVPSLQEAMRLTRGRIAVDLDLKTGVVAPIAETIDATETGGQALWFGRPSPALDLAVRHAEVAILMPRAYSLDDVAEICSRYPTAEIIHIDSSFFTAETVRAVRACGARVWINALGEPDKAIAAGDTAAALAPLIEGGANVIQTDEPEAVLAHLRALGRRD